MRLREARLLPRGASFPQGAMPAVSPEAVPAGSACGKFRAAGNFAGACLPSVLRGNMLAVPGLGAMPEKWPRVPRGGGLCGNAAAFLLRAGTAVGNIRAAGEKPLHPACVPFCGRGEGPAAKKGPACLRSLEGRESACPGRGGISAILGMM